MYNDGAEIGKVRRRRFRPLGLPTTSKMADADKSIQSRARRGEEEEPTFFPPFFFLPPPSLVSTSTTLGRTNVWAGKGHNELALHKTRWKIDRTTVLLLLSILLHSASLPSSFYPLPFLFRVKADGLLIFSAGFFK